MKTVIFNADDFGASTETNHAIIRAHKEGVLTSTSLMMNEPGVIEAIHLAKETQSLAVGLHLTLSDGHPAFPPASIPNLVGQDGNFFTDPIRTAMRCLFITSAKLEAIKEVHKQFELFAGTGLPWDHVNGHQHLHILPAVWDATLKFCEEYNVRRIRIPNEEFAPANNERWAMRRVEMIFFNTVRKRCHRTLMGRNFIVADRVYGQQETGNMREEYVLGLLDRLGGQTNEIYLHPGTLHARPLAGNLAGMDVDLQALLSVRLKAKLEDMRLQTGTYSSIAEDTVTQR